MDRATLLSNIKTTKQFHATLLAMAKRARYEGIDGAAEVLADAANQMATEVECAEYDAQTPEPWPGSISRGTV